MERVGGAAHARLFARDLEAHVIVDLQRLSGPVPVYFAGCG